MTVFENTLSFRKGVASESPPRVSSETRAIIVAKSKFPIVFSTILSAGSKETPLFARVPSVRAKRPSAAAWNTGPTSGRRSFNLSQAKAPLGERKSVLTPAIAATAPTRIHGQCCCRSALARNRTNVGHGRMLSISCSMLKSFGNTTVSRIATVKIPNASTNAG